MAISERNGREGRRANRRARSASIALAEVRVILHGGEPLLAGATRLGEIAAQLRAAITPVCALDLRIHTNGVQLDEEFCEVFLAAGVKVGISLDGDRAGNDRHRRYRDGRSSYDQVIARGRPAQDRPVPAALHRAAVHDRRPQRPGRRPTTRWPRSIRPPSTSCSRTPPGTPRRPGPGRARPYADWLAAVFERWLADDRPGAGPDVRVDHQDLARRQLADRVARARGERRGRHRDRRRRSSRPTRSRSPTTGRPPPASTSSATRSARPPGTRPSRPGSSASTA